MKLRPLTGTITALATPFHKGAVCYPDLAQLVAFQIRSGINGLVPVGTTGESPTLSHDEHMDVVRFVIDAARGRVPVIAGTGSNSTQEAVELTTLSHEAGADAMLVVAPYYNKPSQEGLFRHFCAVAEATDKPIILYSIPGRCGIEIGVPVVERLRARYPHVRWIKEAGGSVDRVDQLKQALARRLGDMADAAALSHPGEDEFALLCEEPALPGLLQALHQAMGRPLATSARELHVDASIGVALFLGWQVLGNGGARMGGAPSGPTVAPRNAAVARMSYGRFLDYVDAGRVTAVDIFDGGRTAVVEAVDPDLDNRGQRDRLEVRTGDLHFLATADNTVSKFGEDTQARLRTTQGSCHLLFDLE